MTTTEILEATGIVLTVAQLVILAFVVYDYGYRAGQTDALKGKQQYKLIEFEDETRFFLQKPKAGRFYKAF